MTTRSWISILLIMALLLGSLPGAGGKGFLSDRALSNDSLSLPEDVEEPLLRGIKAVESGDLYAAFNLFNAALGKAHADGSAYGESVVQNQIGLFYHSVGQVETAKEYYTKALTLRKRLSVRDELGEAAIQSNIGGYYHSKKQFRLALKTYQKALPIKQRFKDRLGEAKLLYNMGRVYSDIGRENGDAHQYKQALDYFKRALEVARDTYSQYLEARNPDLLHVSEKGILTVWGNARPQISEKGIENWSSAYPLLRSVHSKLLEPALLESIGSTYKVLGDRSQALANYQEALNLAEMLGDKEEEAIVMNAMASLESAQQAAQHRKDAVTLLETVRASLGDLAEAKMNYLASHLEPYHDYINQLVEEKQDEEAFTWAEKTKARVLMDLMQSAKSAPSLLRDLSEAERASIQNAEKNVQEAYSKNIVTALSHVDTLQANQELMRAEATYQEALSQLKAKHKEVALQRAEKSFTLSEITSEDVPPDTALLSYITLPSHNKTLLLCVTMEQGKAVVRTYTITNATELAKLANDFRKDCSNPAKQDYEEKARRLYALLVAPAAPQIENKRRLIISPDGPLWGMPFQALLSDTKRANKNTFLLENFEIVYSYSASMIPVMRQLSQRQKQPPAIPLLAFAPFNEGSANPSANRPLGELGWTFVTSRKLTRHKVPTLRFTEDEVKMLEREYPHSEIKRGPQAQEKLAKEYASQAGILHFATHGFFCETPPLISSIVMASPSDTNNDGFLTAQEICQMRLPVCSLVVLSACETARGQVQNGEGIVGLTWAFSVAGAPSELVSQWQVNDPATAKLMDEFYSAWKGGISKSSALQRASLAIKETNSHPYYWAPFVMVGAWQ